MKIVRLEVNQGDMDYRLPIGLIFRAPKTGEAFELFRRKHRECDRNGVGKQTWWVKRS